MIKKEICITFGLIVLALFILWAYQFSPPEVCRAKGGDWDNVYVQCVEKGQTFWDKFPFPPEPCSCDGGGSE